MKYSLATSVFYYMFIRYTEAFILPYAHLIIPGRETETNNPTVRAYSRINVWSIAPGIKIIEQLLTRITATDSTASQEYPSVNVIL